MNANKFSGASSLIGRVEALESKSIDYKAALERTERGDTKLFKLALWAIGIVVSVGGFIVPAISLVNSFRTEVNVDKEIESQRKNFERFLNDADKKVSDLTARAVVKAATTSSTNLIGNLIDGRPEISKFRIDNTIATFYESNIRFFINAEVETTGVGKIVGIWTRYEGRLAEILSKNTDGKTDKFRLQQYYKGSNIYFSPMVIANGSPLSINWTIGMRHKRCDEAFKLIDQLTDDNDLGFIEVSPIVEQSNGRFPSKMYKVNISDHYPTFTCDELESKPVDKIESAPSNTSLPGAKTSR